MGAKRNALIAVAVVATLVLAAGAFVFKSNEPVWQGRRLSSWLNDFDAEDMEKRVAAAEAVQRIGSNAVPFLVPRLAYPRYGPIFSWSGVKTRLFYFLSQRQHFIKVPRLPLTSPRHQALAAIDALGPDAEDALPALEKLLHEHPPDPQAPYVIARVGPTGVPLLNKALTNDEHFVRMAAGVCLDMVNSNSPVLFPSSVTGGFDRRICEFNLRMISAALQEYKRAHPEMEFPSNAKETPHLSLAPDFFPSAQPASQGPKQE